MPQAGGLPFPIDPLRHRPRITVDEAAAAAGELWGLTARATPLPGERDANFLLEDDSGDRFVLKVSSAAERPERLELQHGLIARARERNAALRLPEAVPTNTGALLGSRVLRRTRAPGAPVSVPSRVCRSPPSGGAPMPCWNPSAASLAKCSAPSTVSIIPNWTSTRFPGRRRTLPAVIAAASEVLGGEDASAIYRSVADSIEDDLPDLLALPAGALHNDANDDNLLLAAGNARNAATPEDVALLDFGDAVRGPLICEAATAALYTAATAFEPLPVAARVLAGFAGERPLTEKEADFFGVALAARALVSAGVAALRRTRVAGAAADEYLMVSQAGVWRVLRALKAEAAEVTAGRFRVAAGFSPPASPGGAPRRRPARRRARRGARSAAGSPGLSGPLAGEPGDRSGRRRRNPPARPSGPAREAAGVAIGRYLESRVPETVAGDVPPGPTDGTRHPPVRHRDLRSRGYGGAGPASRRGGMGQRPVRRLRKRHCGRHSPFRGPGGFLDLLPPSRPRIPREPGPRAAASRPEKRSEPSRSPAGAATRLRTSSSRCC